MVAPTTSYNNAEFAKASPVAYYAVPIAYMVFANVIGLIRGIAAIIQYIRVPSQKQIGEMSEKIEAVKDERLKNSFKNLTGYMSSAEVKEFWKEEIIRSVMETIFGCFAAFVYLLKDQAYSRPQTRGTFTYTEEATTNNPMFGCKFHGNYLNLDKFVQHFLWISRINYEIDMMNRNTNG